MGDCKVAGCDGDDKISFTCNVCELTFCSEHRLPENHDCTGVRRPGSGTDQVLSTGLQNRSRSSVAGVSGTGNSSSSRKLLLAAGIVIALLFVGIYFSGFTPDGSSVVPTWNTSSPMETNATTTSADNGTSITSTTEQAETGLDRSEIESLVHKKVNEQRQLEGLNELSYDTELEEIARYHSKDMDQNDYFAHTSPDGEEMEDRYDMFGYDCQADMGGNQYATGGENLFKQSFTGYKFTNEELAAETVEGWMNSQGHRENMLEEYWDKEGIGVYIEENGSETTVYVTQNFC